jgi:hypothetical protein
MASFDPLAVPPTALEHGGVEVLRAAVVQGGLHVSLRRAFDDTMKDPEFLAEAEKTKLTVGALPGEELQKLVAEVAAIKPDILEKVRAAYASK